MNTEISELQTEVADVVVAPAAVEKYRYDQIRDVEAGMPLAVARPRSSAEVQACLRWASRHGVAVVTRGAGTGLSGGARALDGCLILSTESMKAIRVDPLSRVADVEPGALNIEVKEAAAQHGLFYPPDPGSFRISTIGGNIATNAGGLCCVKYGVTSSYVIGLQVVLADGTLLELGGSTIKNVAGLSLTQLVVGSEGTLCVVVGATLRLVPLPPPQVTVVGTFPSLRAAGNAVVEVGRTTRPSMMELIDQQCLNMIEDHRPTGLDRTIAAMLIAQFDDGQDAEAAARVFQAVGADEVHLTNDPAEGDMFVETRRASGPAAESRGARLSEDVAVPIESLPDVLEQIASVSRTLGLEIPVVAHAGDGNIHPSILYNPADPVSTAAAREAFEAIMQIALDAGGTVTGEHGVGRAKRDMAARQLGPEVIDLSTRIRRCFDPAGILNPGVG